MAAVPVLVLVAALLWVGGKSASAQITTTPGVNNPDRPPWTTPQRSRESDDEDTEHVFGFTEGSDLGNRGELEGEVDTVGRFGKHAGYSALSTAMRLKYSATDDFRITPSLSIARHDITGTPELEGRGQWAFEGAALELKYRLLSHNVDPFGLTVGVTPSWGPINSTTGARADTYGLDFSVVMDKELLEGRLYGGLNFLYEPEWSRLRATGEWERRSNLTASAALALRLSPKSFVGMEARYMRAYEGIALGGFAGHALFAGPNFYTRLSPRAGFLVAWNAQLAGKAAGEAGALDLTNFERHQVRVQFTMKLVP